jgi:CHAT domain-containing protein/Tfp pilus assembly protein PilF
MTRSLLLILTKRLVLVCLLAAVSAGGLVVPHPASALFQSTPASPQSSTPPKAEEKITLEPGKPVERTLSGAQTHSYRVVLTQGQYATVIVEQKGVDVAVRVPDAADKLLLLVDSETRPQGEERVPLLADADTAYQLNVKAVYPRMANGAYEIRLTDVRPATDRDRAVFAARKAMTDAMVLSDAGKYDEAIKFGQQALELAEKGSGPDDVYVAEVCERLGLIQRNKGDHADAERNLMRAITIDEQKLGKDNPQTAYAKNALGLVYRSTQDDVKAEKYLQQGLEAMDKSLGTEHPAAALILMNIAGLQERRGDHQPAIAELQRAVAIAEKYLEPDDFLNIALPHNLGDTYLNAGDYDRAEALTERALKAAEKKYGPDHPNITNSLQNLGSIARYRKQYARALELLWRAEKIREKSLGPRHQRTLSLLINIGNVYKDQGDYAKALEQYHQALDALEVTAGPYHDYTLMALANLATVYSLQNDTARALEYQARVDQVVEKQVELNLAVGSERHMLAYSDWLSDRTDRTITLNVQKLPDNRVAREMAALAVLQRKGRVLDASSETIAALHQRLKSDDQKLLDQLTNTDSELARVALVGPAKSSMEEYKKKLSALEEQREELEAEVSRNTAGYFERTTPVTLEAVRAAIPPNAVLIEFSVYHPFHPEAADGSDERYGEPRYVAYVIPNQGEIQGKDLGPIQDIDKTLATLRLALRDPERKDIKQLARAADEKTFQPLRPLLGNATRLLVSPDGDLSLVPIEAFNDEKGHYLVERYSVTYLTSGRDLLRLQASRLSKSGPMIVADPVFGEPATIEVAGVLRHNVSIPANGGQRRSVTTAGTLSGVYFAPLAGTAQEAHSIKALFPNARVVTGTQATTTVLKQVDAPQILHIATHGFFLQDPAHDSKETETKGANSNPDLIENPLLRSGLALAGANLNKTAKTDAGILTALEASNLNLWGTKLVTLSACDTGVGEVKTGEGIYGLRRAFFRAGTETLVMSLWPVSDSVTRQMMTAYYTGLKHGLGRGEALHQAELAMLRRKGHDHPFYWASFIQSGEWANLDGKK